MKKKEYMSIQDLINVLSLLKDKNANVYAELSNSTNRIRCMFKLEGITKTTLKNMGLYFED